MKNKKLDIIHEDKEMIVVNKEPHLLTMGNEKERENTLYHKVSEYVKKQHKSNKIFIVHRLDRDTSGVVLFAKNINLKQELQNDWNKLAKIREYIAVVEGKLEGKGCIKEYLKETKTYLTYASKDRTGDLAITNYEVLKATNNYSVIKINIETGRKNQIRVAMQNLGHPIIGDKKYGSKKNPLRRLCLHASKLVLIHPKTKKELEFNAKIPPQFKIFE